MSKKMLSIGLFAVGLVLSGCAPRVLGATAIQPSGAVDTPAVWIYMHTDDPTKDGVYRCVDDGKQPVCKKATVRAPCIRDTCWKE